MKPHISAEVGKPMILVYPIEVLLSAAALILCQDKTQRAFAYAGTACGVLTLLLYTSPKYVTVAAIPALFLPMIAITLRREIRWSAFGIAGGAMFTSGLAAASLARQMVFELQTAGQLTTRVDACAVQLVPIGVLLLTAASVVLGIFTGLLPNGAVPKPPVWVRLGILAGFAVTGAFLGYTHWADWQTNRPCF